jgi:hypothetical protein
MICSLVVDGDGMNALFKVEAKRFSAASESI